MPGIRQRAVRLFGGLLMAALLLVPVVASGHAHRDLAGSRSCATCIAAHHSPATAPSLAALASAVFGALALALPARVVLVSPQRTPRAGRAPPSRAPFAVA
jgi:hypothetical protein